MRRDLRVGAPVAGQETELRIRRMFTTDGVHPYDEIEWDVRDAVIQNYRTGEVAFEQKGVEVPKAWSQNATNIAAQKYFRGTLGTPQRERSVKQMIDRVVGRYHEEGIERGYFADADEAAIFKDELTHLLVTQKAAFNSPVWFNVGWRPKGEEQVSACQPYHALVATPSGLVPIGKLVEDDAVGTKVFSSGGPTTIIATKANGVKEVLRIHTKAGYTLDVTPDHLVWRRAAEGRGEFVTAGDLRPGDALEWHRSYAYGEAELKPGDVAEAALAGWLQSDGFVGRYTGTNKSLTIEAMTVTSDELDWVTRALDSVFPGVHRHERKVPTQSSELDCRRTRLYGGALENFVERWGLRARGVDMRVPDRLFTSPLPVVAAYLKSIFQAEGYVGLRGNSAVVAVDMISEELIRGIQRLLLRFGIFARVSKKEDARADRQGCWSVRIQTAGDRATFAAEIGFIDRAKAAKLEASLSIPGRPARATKQLEIARIESLGKMEVFDIQTESGEYLSDNLRVHNCFILSVEDEMDSILNWYAEEGRIFKHGSGAGINLSNIRSSKERLRSGGTASGPVSFMRGADASAGTIKSGGATRRAAKMVVLNVGHPDIRDFIWCKALEENKARALRDAGFDMDLDGKDSHSIQYQNANNSVRVGDDFMQAVVEDRDYALKAITAGETIETVKARALMREIAEAAWQCADPGVQYDTTINDWHTCPNSGRINASNPCFTGDTRVHTDKGLVRFDDMVRRVMDGETFDVYTHDITNPDTPRDTITLSKPTQFMVTGVNEVLRLRFTDGREVRCTPNHRFWTTNRGWVRADELTDEDQIPPLDLPTPATMADYRLPVSSDWKSYAVKGTHSRELELPEKWDEELAHYVGWLIGDGCTSGNVVTTIYGSQEDRQEMLPRHMKVIARLNGGVEPKPSIQENGTVQVRLGRGPIAAFFEALGVKRGKARDKVVPWSIFEAPDDIVAAFLRGLFDADGCAYNGATTRYAGLGSKSAELLKGVQVLLARLGIPCRIFDVTGRQSDRGFRYVRKKSGDEVRYASTGKSYDLRIGGKALGLFFGLVGFDLERKLFRLEEMVAEHERYQTNKAARLATRTHDAFELTYNLTEPLNHSYIVNGVVVSNCAEYVHLDDSSCNLASLNLLKFLDADGNFDVEAFKHAVEVVFLAQEISVGFASYPTEKIAENSRTFRQLGQGYANLGALLMTQGLPYDSDEGRAWAAAITALMTGHCYATSAKIAARVGAFEEYAQNEAPMLRVMDKHRDAAYEISDEHAPNELLSAARAAWDEALELGRANGYRNAQATVLAPTGCLVGGTLVPTERGLVRLKSLGNPDGEQWQDLGIDVNTDEGPRSATKFYVNGLEAVVTVETARGYRIKGTPKHRIKVIDETGSWVWKRFAELAEGDRVPLSRRQLIGEPRRVPLPAAPEASSGAAASVPNEMSPELAELVGHALSASARATAEGLLFDVTASDFESADRIAHLGKVLFGIEADRTADRVSLPSENLAGWWHRCGFAQARHIPDAVLASNDPETYSSFTEGLRDKDDVAPRWITASEELSVELQVLLLSQGFDALRHRNGDLWVVSAPELQDGDFVVDEVTSAELGDEEYTFDLSVPDNVTYLANGFISHNTIGLLMDCDTTGIEPDLALKKTKKLVGGGTMSIVNLSVPRALGKLGYSEAEIADIVAYIDEHSHVIGAPHLRDEHLEVFDTAMGERSIHYMGHIKMMAAAQPFLSGAISKTVNLPEDVSVEDVEQVYLEGWRLGLKAIALYRDNCKAAQPLSVTKKEKTVAEQTKATDMPEPVRRRLPKKRLSKTIKFRVADTEGYVTVGEFPDGSVGEMFLKVAKQGSTLAGIMDAFAISISMGLQYGVPLSAYVKQFVNTRFEPSGMTDDPDFRIATSVLDYVFRVLAFEYLPIEDRHALGIRSAGERQDEIEAKLDNAPAEHGNGKGNGHGKPEAASGVVVLGPVADASVGSHPFCGTCGVQMQPAGSCFACPSCGSTSGCS
jgi:ribonucleoside-diphosphate reductase alpha chain